MKEFIGHIAGLRLRGALRRTCRLLAGHRGRSPEGGHPAFAVVSDMALHAFRLLAGRVRIMGGRRARRRFGPVLDAFITARSVELALTAGETRLLRQAWFDHAEGRDPREAVGLLLASFRQRRNRKELSHPTDAAVDPDIDALWHRRLTAALLDELAAATIAPVGWVAAGPRPFTAAATCCRQAVRRARGPPAARFSRHPDKPGDRRHRAAGAGRVRFSAFRRGAAPTVCAGKPGGSTVTTGLWGEESVGVMRGW